MLRRVLAAIVAAAVASPASSQVLNGRAALSGSVGLRPLRALPPSLPLTLAAPGLSAPALAPLAAPAHAPAPAAADAPEAALGAVSGLAAALATLPGEGAGSSSAEELSRRFFDLSAPADAPPAPVAADPADPAAAFAARAQGLFAGRELRPGQRLGVAWKGDGSRAQGSLPSDGELNERVARSPLTNAERMRAVIELFKLGGASDADIVLQDAGRGSSNVIVTKKGRTDRVIVVGAHYDKVREGRGVIDNWTGASLVANLYQALHGVETDATVVFIAFAREEEGLIGSGRYVDSLSRERRDKVDAMVNLDTLAVNGTFAWQGHSTQALVDRIVEVAAATRHPAQAARLWGGDADSSSFRQAGIPAVTVFGASQDVIFDIIHSENDNMAAFDLAHYRNAYLLLIETLKSLDARPLGAEGRRRV